MKKIYIRLLLCLLGLSLGMVSCIHDGTTGFVNEVSDITIAKMSGDGMNESGDAAFVEFMKPVHFEAEVSQSLKEYELAYEWRVGYISDYKDGKPVIDSMRFVSTEPALEYAFNRMGEFLVRLRVYNEFGSTFHYVTVTVKAGMETGLLVLSSDDAGNGRLSFCPVLSDANELLQAKAEDFNVDVWSMINPDFELRDAWDICLMNSGNYKGSVFVLSESQKCIYELEKNTLMVLRKMDLTPLLEWDIQPVALSVYNTNLGVLSKGGQVVGSQLTANGLVNDSWWGKDMKATKLYQADFINAAEEATIISFPMIADNDQEKMFLYQGSSKVYNSGNEFSGHRIINYLLVGERVKRLVVVSESKNSSGKVRITVFNQVPDHWTLGELFAKESESQVRDYSVSSPLTLTPESQVLYNGLWNEVFYTSGNKVYRWRYTDALPDASASGRNVLTIPGEATCIAQSPDGEYLYVGGYDAGASGLKGNVYVYKTQDFSFVAKFEGVADKPLKLFYKDVK